MDKIIEPENVEKVFFIPRVAGHGSRRTVGAKELVEPPSLYLTGEDSEQAALLVLLQAGELPGVS